MDSRNCWGTCSPSARTLLVFDHWLTCLGFVKVNQMMDGRWNRQAKINTRYCFALDICLQLVSWVWSITPMSYLMSLDVRFSHYWSNNETIHEKAFVGVSIWAFDLLPAWFDIQEVPSLFIIEGTVFTKRVPRGNQEYALMTVGWWQIWENVFKIQESCPQLFS